MAFAFYVRPLNRKPANFEDAAVDRMVSGLRNNLPHLFPDGRLPIDTGTITPLLKRLESGGLVTKRRDPKDERRVIVTLTAAGEVREAVRIVPEQIQSACQITNDQAQSIWQTLDETGRSIDA